MEELVSCSDICLEIGLLESKVLKVRAQDLSLVHIFDSFGNGLLGSKIAEGPLSRIVACPDFVLS